MTQLSEMGISAGQAIRALVATDGDVNRALDWVFSHPDDSGEEGGQHSDLQSEARHETPGYSTTPAKYQLQSIVCHKGSSIHAG